MDLSWRKAPVSAEGLAQAALDALEAQAAVLDEDGVVRAVNSAWRRLGEAALTAALRAPVGVGGDFLRACETAAQAGDLCAREAAEGVRAVLRGRRAGFSLDYARHTPAGTRWFNLSVTSLAGGGAILIYTDVSVHAPRPTVPGAEERRERRNASPRLEASRLLLFETNPQPMWIYDVATRRVVDVNEAALAQYGYARQELLGLSIEALRPAEDVPRLLEHLGESRPRFSPRDEWRHRKKDGTVFYADVSAHSTVHEGRDARLVMASDVSERKLAEEALRRSEERYRTLAAHIPDCDLYLFDHDMRFVLADGTEMAWLGLDKAAFVGKTPRELLGEETAVTLEGLYWRTVAGQEASVELTFRNRIYNIHTVPIRGADQPYAGMALVQNVTERKRQETETRRLAAFSSELVNFFDESLRHGLDGTFYGRFLTRALGLIPGAEAGSLLLRGDDGRYRFVATVGFDLKGLSALMLEAHELYCDPARAEPQIVVGRPPRRLDPERAALLEAHGRLGEIRASVVAPIEVGGEFVAYLSLNAFSDEPFGDETLALVRALVQPVAVLFQRQALEAELLERQRELERLANHDPLTGLPNRALFYDRLGAALKNARRSGEVLALVYLDLDGFKRVNDSLGHGAGDELLIAVAERLRLCVRENDTVARLGGDEFVCILSGLAGPDGAALVAEKVLACLEQPFVLGGGSPQEGRLEEGLRVTTSIGVALYPGDAQDADTLVRHADLALYRVKETGRNGFAFFAPA